MKSPEASIAKSPSRPRSHSATLDDHVHRNRLPSNRRSDQYIALQVNSVQRHIARQSPSAQSPVEKTHDVLHRHPFCCGWRSLPLVRRRCRFGGLSCLRCRKLTQIERPAFCHQLPNQKPPIPYGGRERKLGLERRHCENRSVDLQLQLGDIDFPKARPKRSQGSLKSRLPGQHGLRNPGLDDRRKRHRAEKHDQSDGQHQAV